MDFSKLTTPQNDGDVLIEPHARELPLLLSANRAAMRDHTFSVMGLPFRNIRRESRLNMDPDEPLVVTGHQPEFIHSGVWAKHVVAVRLAKAVGGSALNLVVDHDSPKSNILTVPDTTSFPNQIRQVKVFESLSGSAYEQTAIPPLAVTESLIGECQNLLTTHYDSSMLPVFFNAYRKKSLIESTEGNLPRDWVDLMVQSRIALEKKLNIEIANKRVSDLSMLPLLGEIVTNAERFVSAYNRALFDYRKSFRVKSHTRPLPDLHVEPGIYEIPFWAYKPNLPRKRLFVKISASALSLLAGEELILETSKQFFCKLEKTKSILSEISPWTIRPRALILTLWARLFLADLFIHGIGGAKYDRITDGLIRNYFNINPPAIACVSATLYMNLLQHPVSQSELKRARHLLRDIQFNSQRYIPDNVASELITQKETAIARALELKQNKPGEHFIRKQVFGEIRAINRKLFAITAPEQKRISDRAQMLASQSIQHQNAVRRDYFFAMLPEHKLHILLRNLPDVQDFLS